MKNIFVFALAIGVIALLCCACNQSPVEPRISITDFVRSPNGNGTFSGTISKLAESSLLVSIQIEHPDYPSTTTIEVSISKDGDIKISGINGSKLNSYHAFGIDGNGGATFQIEVPDLPQNSWAAIAKATFFYPEDALESEIFTSPK